MKASRVPPMIKAMMKPTILFLAVLFLSACTKTVPVTDVVLSKSEIEVTEGEKYLLSVTVSPANATDKTVKWESSNLFVATVSQDGLLEGLHEGNAVISVSCGGLQKYCKVKVLKAAIPVSSVTLDKPSLTLVEGESYTLTATVAPEDATDQTLTWSSSDSSVAAVIDGKVTAVKPGSATITAKSGDKSATCDVTVEKKPSCPDSVKAVDLGLPSGLKWASCNIGATKPEEYGEYFAWGETQAKSAYGWSNYKWCNGADTKLTKYCNKSSYWDSSNPLDNKTVLDPEDDAATANWGGDWRMPTDAEWTEMFLRCAYTWDSNYNGTGIAGIVITAGNGNSIFLPAAGLRDNTKLVDAGSGGSYWSSSLTTGMPSRAWYNLFYSGGIHRYEINRFYGLSVRPVTK